MTEIEAYTVLLKALGEIIQSKNETISLRDYQIEDLRKRLDEAYKRIAELDNF